MGQQGLRFLHFACLSAAQIKSPIGLWISACWGASGAPSGYPLASSARRNAFQASRVPPPAISTHHYGPTAAVSTVFGTQRCPQVVPEGSTLKVNGSLSPFAHLMKDVLYFTDWLAPDPFMALFQQRAGKQIMGLGMLAIAMALCSFGPMLQDLNVRVFSDNAGSEAAAKMGTATGCRGTATGWLTVFGSRRSRRRKDGNIRLHVVRVPIKDNMAALPSRCDYKLLCELGAAWVGQMLHEIFWSESSWESIRILGRCERLCVCKGQQAKL